MKKNRTKTARKKSAESKKRTAKKKLQGKKNERASVRRSRSTESSSRSESKERASGELSGDLQGLSTVETADSESVDELLEEGNAFEAGIVEGVEDAEARSERGVHTREVPEDDVPSEYLDRDD